MAAMENRRVGPITALEIFDVLKAAGDLDMAKQMSAYMRDQFPFLGIPSPQRKKLGQPFFATIDKKVIDWEFIALCWEQPEREFQYLGADYLAKLQSVLAPADIPRIRELVVTKSWWDTVDALDVVVGSVALAHPEVNEILLQWSTDENIWLRRTAIDHQLTRKGKTDTDLLERILVNNLGQTEFFINKAIGWSLRDYSKTDPDWVRGFITRHRDGMAPLSIREASKYI